MAKDEGRFGGRKRWEREGGFGGVEGEGGGRVFFFYFKYLLCFNFPLRVGKRNGFAKQVQFCKLAEVGTGWGCGG